jgi:hypothetical protein
MLRGPHKIIVLSWLLDMVTMSIHLLTHHLARLFKILDTIGPTHHPTTINKWQKVIGEIHSMVLIIPDGTGLFSVFQNILHQKSNHGTKVRPPTTMHEVLANFLWPATDLAQRSNHILEVVPSLLPHALGTQDAKTSGMGSVHVIPLVDVTIELNMRCAPFSLSTQAKFIYYTNPLETITNIDLELTASIVTHDVLAQKI